MADRADQSSIDEPSPRGWSRYRAQPEPRVDMSATSTGFSFNPYDDTSSGGSQGRARSNLDPPSAGRGTQQPRPGARQFGTHEGSRKGRATVGGQARGIQQRSESYGENGARSVLTFRIERYDRAGNRLRPVPVQMRTLGFDGSLSEGDEVSVTGQWKHGTLHTSRVHNLTTGASIVGKSFKKACLIFLVVAIVMAIVFVFAAVRMFQAFQDQVNQDQRNFQKQEQQQEQDYQKHVKQQQEEPDAQKAYEEGLRKFCHDVAQRGSTAAGC